MWKNSWNCNARGDKYSNLTFGGVVFTISKLWKNSSNCNARGDKYSNLTFRGMTIWRDFSQLSYSKSNPPKVKLLYLSPLALQFDEFFPMINGFLKYVGVLIEVYTMRHFEWFWHTVKYRYVIGQSLFTIVKKMLLYYCFDLFCVCRVQWTLVIDLSLGVPPAYNHWYIKSRSFGYSR